MEDNALLIEPKKVRFEIVFFSHERIQLMRRQSSVTEGVVQKNTIVLYCLRRTTVAVHWGNESLLSVGMVANLNLVAPVIAA